MRNKRFEIYLVRFPIYFALIDLFGFKINQSVQHLIVIKTKNQPSDRFKVLTKVKIKLKLKLVNAKM